MKFDEFAKLYCDTQVQTPEELRKILFKQKINYGPDGWILLECNQMDSSRIGERTILLFGPNNTYKTVPDHPVSPRGLASDMSVVIATLDKGEI